MKARRNAAVLAMALGLSSSPALAEASWEVRPIDGQRKTLEDADLTVVSSEQLKIQNSGDVVVVSLGAPHTAVATATIQMKAGRGAYLPLQVNLVENILPGEKICAHREWFPARVDLPENEVAYIIGTYASYSGIKGDLEGASIRYQILGQIVQERLGKLEAGKRPTLATDVKSLYNFLQIVRDLGRSSCVRPPSVARQGARFLRDLAERDIAAINAALGRSKKRAADIKMLTDEVLFMDSLHFQAHWRAISREGVMLKTCPQFVGLRDALLSNLRTRDLIAMEGHKTYRLLLHVEDALERCVNREAEAIVNQNGVLDRESWNRIRLTYAPIDIPGMGALTADAVESHRKTMAKWEATVP